jgi:ferredoxin
MANHARRYAENASGTFYVDQECTACDTCVSMAPLHFRLTPNSSHAFVMTQPRTASETDRCQKALATCPVGAIGQTQE